MMEDSEREAALNPYRRDRDMGNVGQGVTMDLESRVNEAEV